MSGFDLSSIAWRILGSSPTLLVLVGGIALCLIRDTRPLRVRVLAGAAVALQLFNVALMPFIFQMVLSMAQQGGGGVAGISMQMTVLSMFSSSISAVALALLLWAAFTHDDRPVA